MTIAVNSPSDPRPIDRVKPASARLAGLELGRIAACLAVIVIHQDPGDYGGNDAVFDVLRNSAIWAVPFFFILSGYFMPVGSDGVKLTGKYLGRLAPIAIFWITIYATVWGDPLWFLGDIKAVLKVSYTGGAGYHLWFLPALGICLTIAAMFLHFRAVKLLFVTGVAVFVIGLVSGPYLPAVSGMAEPAFNTRNGPFFGLFFVASGVVLRVADVRPGRLAAAGLVMCGMLLLAAEIAFLGTVSDAPPRRYDYLLASVPISVGMFFLFLGLDIRSPRMAGVIRVVGSASLGIYAAHALVLQVMTQALAPSSVGTGLVVALSVLVLCTVLSLIGGQVPVLRRMFR